MVSQAILGIRTYNIARRNVQIGRIVASAYFLASVFLWFTALYNRQAEMADGNCIIGSAHPDQTLSAWSFYFIAMIYDFLVLFISTYHLFKLRVSSASSASSKLLNILLYDGLGYFVALTATNLANILLYRGVGSDIQTSGTSLEYAAIWIMSQRILLHLREERVQQASLIVSQIPKPPSRNRLDGNPTMDIQNNYDTALSDYNHVGVRIERTIIRDAKPRAIDEESESTEAGRDVYPPPISVQVWDEIKTSKV